jgi:hypothetical protein
MARVNQYRMPGSGDKSIRKILPHRDRSKTFVQQDDHRPLPCSRARWFDNAEFKPMSARGEMHAYTPR